MSIARILLASSVAACAPVAACGSFGANPDPSAGADAAADATAADATSPDGAPLPDGSSRPACTAQAITDSFEQGWPGWDTSRADGLSADSVLTRSPPTSLLLQLAPNVATPRFLVRKLPSCHVKLSIWLYVQGGFGDGEVDFLTVTDGVGRDTPGLHIVGAKAIPGALSVEDPGGPQRKTKAAADTWVEVAMEVNPITQFYSVVVADEAFDGALPSTFGSGGDLYLRVGATWVDGSHTTTWKVYFDDLTVNVLP